MNGIVTTRRVCFLVAIAAVAPYAASAQPFDVTWTFGDVGIESYRLDAFTPADTEFGALGSEDPTLPLSLGGRYQITITNYTFHPFAVIAKGTSAGQDRVLLSTSRAGSFESDPGVAWTDNGQGVIAFTLTLDLYEAMIEGGRVPGYRCEVHTTTMRGDFTISGLPIAERIQPSPVRVALVPVGTGLAAPVALEPDPANPALMYVADQTGQVYTIENGQMAAEPFLDVNDLMVELRAGYDERGLLGLAFHPGHADDSSPGYGLFYTYTSEPVQDAADFTLELPPDTTMNHQSVVREWFWFSGDGPVDPMSSREVLRVDEPQGNHNAGHMEFGPDGYLYVTFGDGGGADDTGNGHGTGNGQNINTIHGSIIRIDPLDPALTPNSNDAPSANGAYRIPTDNPFVGTDGIDEIYAYGLRNPYRFSFDRQSGALILPDVGQNRVEEINFGQKGANYGWNLEEGAFSFDPDTAEVGPPLDDPALTHPVAQYDHDDGIAVVAGYAYYGSAFPDLWGRYVFGDFSLSFSEPTGRLFEADLFTGEIRDLLIGPAGDPLNMFVKGFGQDAAGEVYLLASTAGGPSGDTGVVLKIVPIPTELVADLSGAGAGTEDTATGEARFTLDSEAGALSYELDVNGIVDVTQAHIHVADTPGGNGAPAVWLYPAAPPAELIPGEFTGQLGAGEITDADLVGPLAGMTLADLFTAIREDRAYVNVHNEAFPPGAIRGPVQAVPTAAPIAAVLNGAGAGTDSTATGIATVTPNADGTLSYALKIQGLENVTQAHIHVADTPGGNGAPALWLYPAAPPAELIPGEFTGQLGAGMATDADLVGPLAGMTIADLMTAIAEGRAYVNVHTDQFPPGEIRGPLQ